MSAGSYRLELGGQSLSVNAIEGGGTVGVVISGPPTGGSPFREKHLAGCGMNQSRLPPRSVVAPTPSGVAQSFSANVLPSAPMSTLR